MTSHQGRLAAILISAGLLFIATSCTPSARQSGENPDAESVSQQRSSSPANDTLLATASFFEDLTEFAELGNGPALDDAIDAVRRRMPNVQTELEPSARGHMDSLMTELDRARASGENRTVALLGVEAYRTLISALDESAMAVPKAVALLDYAGFKLHVLAGAADPDWDLMEEVVLEADGYWRSIEGKVGLSGLRDAMTTTMEGMQDAVAVRDADMMSFAARVDLDLVDLLEGYFEEHPLHS